MTGRRVPFVDLRGSARPDAERRATDAAIRRVIERGRFVLGPEVEAFEEEFAAASGVSHAVGVGNGTDALYLVLTALGIGRGDEVITTPLSAAFTALAITMTGARPVFADIDPDRLTLDPDAVRAAVGARTAAILPVHLYGQPADLPALAGVADRHGLALVEDCCQAHLATCRGRPVATFGRGGAFSFYPTKNLGGLGDGGAVCTDDIELAERVRQLRNGGQAATYDHRLAGCNSRLDEIQAAVLRERLAELPAGTDRRRALARRYRHALGESELSVVTVPPEADTGHVYHLFPVRSRGRGALREHLRSRGIDTLIHYPRPLTRQPAFAGMNPGVCPLADAVCADVLSLPLTPDLTGADVEAVVDAIRSFTPEPG